MPSQELWSLLAGGASIMRRKTIAFDRTMKAINNSSQRCTTTYSIYRLDIPIHLQENSKIITFRTIIYYALLGEASLSRLTGCPSPQPIPQPTIVFTSLRDQFESYDVHDTNQ